MHSLLSNNLHLAAMDPVQKWTLGIAVLTFALYGKLYLIFSHVFSSFYPFLLLASFERFG